MSISSADVCGPAANTEDPNFVGKINFHVKEETRTKEKEKKTSIRTFDGVILLVQPPLGGRGLDSSRKEGLERFTSVIKRADWL